MHDTSPSGQRLPPPSLPDIRARRRPPLFPALQHRDFRLFYAGFVVSLLGVWMQRVAQSWLVLELTDSAFWVGLVDALGSLPVLVFTLYAGVVADRVSRRPMVIVTQTFAMVFALALAILVLADTIALWHIVVLGALLGTANAFDIPARHALMVDMVGKRDLTNAIALNSSAFNATRIVGPAIAGIVIAAVGVGLCFLLNAVSYLAVIGALFAVRVSAMTGRTSAAESAWVRLGRGFRHVIDERRTRILILNIAVISVFGLPALVLLPVVARDVLGRGAQEYGWMMSAMGVGALVGALTIAVFGHKLPRGRLLGWSTTALGVSVILFGLSRSLAVSLVLLACLGCSMIVTTAITNTLVQTLAPDELRSRVVAFYAWAFVGLSPFGALQAGSMAEWLGAGNAIAIGGTVTAAVAIGLVLRSEEVRATR
ncbi:MAG: MFS transporter [Gemmatimonadota bacterium]|nr:MFS transporter [Gemmatimonadota bacterium]MDH3478366.1 MFS transporter [Gemmatimonadota bacterium]MDH3570794.1 MFS transporter [Gemmatimonadota bacterium]MDH5550686.1 MFS transporter [Gemmatimonadota bacterium]